VIEFTAALAAVAAKAETLLKVAKGALTLDQREMLMDMRERILGLRESALDLVQENQRLRAELENERAMKATEKRGDFLFDAEGNGPFCIVCAAKDRRLIPLIRESVSSDMHTCHGCGNVFNP
jgi:hypothetical protein